MELFEEIVSDLKLSYNGRDLINPLDEEASFLDNPPCIINEGLITTYPIDISINAFAKVYQLYVTNSRNSGYMIFKENIGNKDFNGVIWKENGQNNTERISLLIGDTEYNKKLIEKYFTKYGYIFSNKEEFYFNWCILIFEKKFDNDVTEIVKTEHYVYHITKMSLKEKILKQGIVPKNSQWSRFNHNSRCYFFICFDKNQIDRLVMNFRLSKKQWKEKYMLLKINVDNLDKSVRFYSDPRIKNGVYTLEGIPPKAISVEEENITGNLY